MKVSDGAPIAPATTLRDLPGFTDGVLAAQCPSRTVLDHVTSKWGVLILLALGTGTMRWSELRRCVEGISEKMLAQTLRTLENDEIVRRVAKPVVPPHVEYSLTDRGRDLHDRLAPLMEWIAGHADEIVG
ncbi:MAG: helix-turn-helix transcriptional regulator [Actinomycetota bacterium]|nr:helix-turn-helix transcriptional regulator [Actinomycetota bacterium]